MWTFGLGIPLLLARAWVRRRHISSGVAGAMGTVNEMLDPDRADVEILARAREGEQDETGVLVRDQEKCRRGHFWVVVAPMRHVLFRSPVGQLLLFSTPPAAH